MKPGISEHGSPSEYIEDIHAALAHVSNNKIRYERSKGCYFTNSLDENYIIDKSGPTEYVVAGLSGHGFKFAPALASGLMDAVEAGVVPDHLECFNLSRFVHGKITARTHIEVRDTLFGQNWEI